MCLNLHGCYVNVATSVVRACLKIQVIVTVLLWLGLPLASLPLPRSSEHEAHVTQGWRYLLLVRLFFLVVGTLHASISQDFLPVVAFQVFSGNCLMQACHAYWSCGWLLQVTAVETLLTELDNGIKSAQAQVVKACEGRQSDSSPSKPSEEVRALFFLLYPEIWEQGGPT